MADGLCRMFSTMKGEIMEEAKQLKEEGNNYFKAGDYQKATSCYTKCLSLQSAGEDAAIYYKNRAACYLKLEKYEKAEKDASSALDIAPNDTKALFRRCQALEKLGKYEDAFKDARKVAHFEPKNSAVKPLLASLSKKLQEMAKEQSSTVNQVNQMFNLVFSPGGDMEKRHQAVNNLVVLARENSGAERILAENGVQKLLELLKTETDSEMVIGALRTLGQLGKRNIPRAKLLLNDFKIVRPICQFFRTKNEDLLTISSHVLQTLLNTFSGINKNEDKKCDATLMLENIKEIELLYLAVSNMLDDGHISGVGRDAVIDILIKNITEMNGVNWIPNFLESKGLQKLLHVATCIPEMTDLPITINTRSHIALALQCIYNDLGGDKKREAYRVICDDFVKKYLLDNTIESKVKIVSCISALLQGPFDVGNLILGSSGILEMMLVMAGSEETLLQQVAAEAIINCASKKDKCSSIVDQGIPILKKLYQSKNDTIKVRALVGLCKVGSSGGTDADSKSLAEGAILKLSSACRRYLKNPEKDKDLRKWAAEGLAYLTLDADVKEDFIEDKEALKALIELAKQGDENTLYGVVSTLVNLTNSYDKPEYTPELMEIAEFSKQHVPKDHPKDAEEFLSKRTKALVKEGVAAALVAFSKTQSHSSRELLSRVFAAIAEDQDHRGTIVQQGGAKALIPLSLEGTDKGKGCAAQALAKIGITINPEVAFPGQRMYEVVRPLIHLLHMDKSGLQNFEALMALTNIAGVSDSARRRIYKERGLPSIENYMYEDHLMIKRAAIQCVVNLLFNEEVYSLYVNSDTDRVKLLFLYCGEEDRESALAAAAGTAMLTDHPKGCEKVLKVGSWMDVLKEVIVLEDFELQYRGALILSNLCNHDKAATEKIVDSELFVLLKAFVDCEDPRVAKIKECCKRILDKAIEYRLIKPPEED